ncbi:DoxX family protein [Ferruginibacter yonginensis]|uniref:DoxX family protein n=1 Tax=Ferruginibacter yonginensis TaxID=1310416 RepID=A0ABV8QU89_9BACT
MKKFLSTHYSAGAFNTATLLLRVCIGGMMMMHGYDKMVHFNATAQHMMNFMGIGSTATTALVIFAEFFCSLLLILGLFTRLACIPLIICMGVALIKAHHNDFLGEGQPAAMYLVCFIALLLTGAGKVSVDSMISK